MLSGFGNPVYYPLFHTGHHGNKPANRAERVWGLEFGVWGLGFLVWSFWFGSWKKFVGLGFLVWELEEVCGLWVWGLGFVVCGLWFVVWGLGSRRVWGFWFQGWELEEVCRLWDLRACLAS
jgi:hypothetical protein